MKKAIFGALSVEILLLLNCPVVGAADLVRREISIAKGAVHVTDHLSISANLAMQKPVLTEVYETGLDEDANFNQKVAKLLDGEDLHIDDCKKQRHGKTLDIDIVSTVRFATSNNEAMIRLTPTFAGNYVAAGTTSGKDWDALTILALGGKFFVLVPELKSYDPAFQMFEKDGYTFSTFFSGSEKFECVLKSGDKTVSILSWDKGDGANIINPSVARRWDGFAQMSGNDQLTLCTPLKLAKPGYYLIEPGK